MLSTHIYIVLSAREFYYALDQYLHVVCLFINTNYKLGMRDSISSYVV